MASEKLRSFAADTVALVIFFTIVSGLNERFIAGMSWPEVAVSRTIGAPLMVLTARPYGFWRLVFEDHQPPLARFNPDHGFHCAAGVSGADLCVHHLCKRGKGHGDRYRSVGICGADADPGTAVWTMARIRAVPFWTERAGAKADVAGRIKENFPAAAVAGFITFSGRSGPC